MGRARVSPADTAGNCADRRRGDLAVAAGVLQQLAACPAEFPHSTDGLGGGVMAAFLGGGVVSLGSLIGFLTVFGIAARNEIC